MGLQHLHSAHADETDYDDIELGTNLRALMTTFESRRDLTKRDLDVIKKLGLTFKGPHDWPLFRSWEAGYAPWYLSQSEAVFLTHVLQQVTDVYLRARDNPPCCRCSATIITSSGCYRPVPMGQCGRPPHAP